MARPKGVNKTGGRQKGTPNKASQAKAAAVEASGLTPLDYMVSVMRDGELELNVRLDAAKSAAPYIHPRLNSIAHTGKDGGDIKTATSIRVTFVRPGKAD